MKGKILVLSSVIASLAISSSTATLAYLTDTDYNIATFTTGQVRVQTYTVADDRSVNVSDADVIQNATAHLCDNLLSGDECERYIFVKNTGSVDAYTRVRILVPVSLETGDPRPITLLHNNTASEEYEQRSNPMVACGNDTTALCNEYIYTRREVLSANEMTHHPVIGSMISNIVVGASSEGESGESTPVATVPPVSEIKIYTEAVQAQGFTSAEDAFTNFNN